MRSNIILAGLLALSSGLALAETSQWSFTYTGFYSKEEGAFLPDRVLTGSFAGSDSNHDGVLERAELSSLAIGPIDYITCENNAYNACSTTSFAFNPTSKSLSFELGFSNHDPEWYLGRGRTVVTGLSDYSYERDPSKFVEKTYAWTAQTALAVVPVPEPATWAMLGAGLAIVAWRCREGSARRRRG